MKTKDTTASDPQDWKEEEGEYGFLSPCQFEGILNQENIFPRKIYTPDTQVLFLNKMENLAPLVCLDAMKVLRGESWFHCHGLGKNVGLKAVAVHENCSKKNLLALAVSRCEKGKPLCKSAFAGCGKRRAATLINVITVQSWGRTNFGAVGVFGEAH